MIKATIKSIEPATIVSTGERYLDVTVEILDGKKKSIRKFGYALDTKEKVILADLEKTVANLQEEKKQSAISETADTMDANVAKLQDSLIGEEVEAEAETD